MGSKLHQRRLQATWQESSFNLLSGVASYYGLGAADMPSDLLIERALSDSRAVEKLQKVDVNYLGQN